MTIENTEEQPCLLWEILLYSHAFTANIAERHLYKSINTRHKTVNSGLHLYLMHLVCSVTYYFYCGQACVIQSDKPTSKPQNYTFWKTCLKVKNVTLGIILLLWLSMHIVMQYLIYLKPYWAKDHMIMLYLERTWKHFKLSWILF